MALLLVSATSVLCAPMTLNSPEGWSTRMLILMQWRGVKPMLRGLDSLDRLRALWQRYTMPKKNPLDQWGKQSLADQLHCARNFNRYYNKTDDFYKQAFDLQRRLLALQEKARKDLELPKPTPPRRK